MSDALQETNLQDEFRSIAESTWQVRVRKHEGEPVPPMPTLEDLQEALVDGDLDEGMVEFRQCLSHCMALLEEDEAPSRQVYISTTETNLYVIAGDVKTELDTSLVDRSSEIITAYSLPNYHVVWLKAKAKDPSLKHPVAPLVRVWFSRPMAIRPSSDRAGVIPSSMEGVRGQVYLPGLAPVETPLGEQDSMVMLPGFPSLQDSVIPTTLIRAWQAGGGMAKKRGQGAPLALRSFFEFLTMPRYEERRMGQRLRVTMTLKEYRDIHYSKGADNRSTFKPKRHLAKVREALEEVDQMRVDAMLPGYDVPTLWRPISITSLPKLDLDSPITADIEMPPGSARGAMIDKYALRYFGRKSSVQYVAALGLAYYWDKYGTHRNSRRPIMATRPLVARSKQGLPVGTDGVPLLNGQGKPVTGFADPRMVFLDTNRQPVDGDTLAERRRLAARERNPAADRYPVLHNRDLLMLCYPEDSRELVGNVLWQRMYRSKEALATMAELGYCVIETVEGDLGEPAYRILPTGWESFGNHIL